MFKIIEYNKQNLGMFWLKINIYNVQSFQAIERDFSLWIKKIYWLSNPVVAKAVQLPAKQAFFCQ